MIIIDIHKQGTLLLLLHYDFQVEATFLRAVHENVKVEHVILEVNSLRYVSFFGFLLN